MSGHRQDSPVQDRFAELLSEGLSTAEAALAMGYPPNKGRKLLLLIRRKLGPQAV